MSVSELFERVEVQLMNALHLDLPRIRSDIHVEHERATTTADRVALLAIHKIVMDAAEQGLAEQALEVHRKLRRQDYRLLLIREARIGGDATDRNIDPQRMAAITQREVEAGRMAPDDDLHEFAVAAAANIPAPLPTSAAKKRVKSAGAARFKRWAVVPIAIGLAFFAWMFAVEWMENHKKGLTGKARSAFVESAVDACLKTQSAAPENQGLSVFVISQYCTCNANGMADSLSVNELKALVTMIDRETAVAAMQPKMDTIAEQCRSQ